jgi:hypothetical protein
MITLDQYVGPHAGSPDWTPERQENAFGLLAKCSALEAEMIEAGIDFPDSPITKTGVSGEIYGGFRPQSCPIGAPHSNHKEGRAVDRYDPRGEIDAWCMENQDRLRANGIYIEHPSATLHWSHWQSVPPASGHTVFLP